MHQGVEGVIDFHLTGGADFVVRTFNFKAYFTKFDDHLISEISHLVNRRHREVATLETSLVTTVWCAIFFVLIA